MAIKILLPQPIMKEGYDYLQARGYEVVDGRGFTEEDILADVKDCDAILSRTAKITAKILNNAPMLKLVARHGAGYDSVDVEAARQNNILIITAGLSNSISVAELTIFLMLYCSRNFKKVQNTYVDDYLNAKLRIPKTELNGKVLGLVGLGSIGGLVAHKAAMGFDMKVLAYDPFYQGSPPDYLRLVSNRDEIFTASDYVSLHLPATKDTLGSVGKREFGLMKETAYLINTARGAIVDEQALIGALWEGKIGGAGLDTTEAEPIEKDNPLIQMDNVVIAPHIGAATREASARASLACAKGIDDFFSGRTPKNVIPEMFDMI